MSRTRTKYDILHLCFTYQSTHLIHATLHAGKQGKEKKGKINKKHKIAHLLTLLTPIPNEEKKLT